jgi:hypothetical protein
MKLPYENATSGKRAIDDIEKILRAFGCSKFATGSDFDTGEIFIQFDHRNRMISLKASAKGYAAAWLRENPYTPKKRRTRQEHEHKALEIGEVAVYSVLRDWVKGQVTAIEIGVLSFEAAFLSHMMLPNGKRVIEELQEKRLLPNDL